MVTMNRTVKIAGSALLVALAVCAGYVYGTRSVSPTNQSGAHATDSEFTCPMHPFIIKDRPGSCAVCGMELVRKNSGAKLGDQDLRTLSHVSLSPAQQIMANLATSAAVVKPFARSINCTGSIAYNQDRQGKVAAWVGGRIERLQAKSVGSQVRKGMPVAELYSADLYNAQVQYLIAYKTIRILNNSISVPFPVNTQMALGEAYERLRQLGFRDEQFEQLQKSDRPTVRVPLHSQFSGVVTETFVREGQYVNAGEQLCSIADLSRVWVELEVFESDLPHVKAGQQVSIRSRSYPGETFTGAVKLIYPFLDPKTRTVKVRVELPNPGLKLKPDMYVQGAITVSQADALVVPAGAVMDTGARQVVWVESEPGVFIMRNVTTGGRSGAEVLILSGLKPGEKVAATGAYLIDSEAQLSSGSAAPAQKQKDDMDMGDTSMHEPAGQPHGK